jgi:hypothetical protein
MSRRFGTGIGKRLLVVMLAAGILLPAPCGVLRADARHDAAAAYKTGDYKTAARLFKVAAEAGDLESQANLGTMYAVGQGVKRDPAEAVRLYRQAAERGYAPAQSQLGEMYYSGLGVAHSDGEAVHW